MMDCGKDHLELTLTRRQGTQEEDWMDTSNHRNITYSKVFKSKWFVKLIVYIRP